jgi:MFS family permease
MIQTLFTQGTVAICMTISSELFPTPARTLGLGIVNCVGRSGAILGPLILGFFFKFGTAINHIIYFFAVPLVAASIITLFTITIDPRKKTLEAITQEAEKTVGARAH